MDKARARFTEAARNGDPVALTGWLVSIPSVNPVLEEGGAGEVQIAEACAELLEAWGFETTITEPSPGRPNVIGRLEGSGPTLLLNGHLDTVGVAGMTVDPFGADMDGHRMYGRGSCDMKAGDAALLAAAHRLATEGPRPGLIVALTSDEEHASVGMADLVAGSGPGADLAVVCEPTSLRVMPAHKGFVWIRALFEGVAAHGSRPDIGIDAIRHAALYLAELEGYAEELRRRPAHPLLEYGSFHAGTIRGGSAESVYPDRCELLLERRTMPGESPQEVVAEFQAALDTLERRDPTLSATLDMTLERPGTEVARDHRLVQGLLAAGEASGVEPIVEGMTAWVDAAFLNEAGIPAVCYGPGSIEQAHTDAEWVDVREIGTCADVLEQFARDLVN
jgi:acetylornithine deacetylase